MKIQKWHTFWATLYMFQTTYPPQWSHHSPELIPMFHSHWVILQRTIILLIEFAISEICIFAYFMHIFSEERNSRWKTLKVQTIAFFSFSQSTERINTNFENSMTLACCKRFSYDFVHRLTLVKNPTVHFTNCWSTLLNSHAHFVLKTKKIF